MRRTLLALAVILCAVPAFAQDVITAYEFRIYASGASAPQIVTPIPIASVTCNLAKVTPPATTVSNPTTALWDDPVNTGRDCRWVMASNGPGPIVALPSGTYTGALVASNAEGASAESARVPFLRERSPGVVTGVRLIR